MLTIAGNLLAWVIFGIENKIAQKYIRNSIINTNLHIKVNFQIANILFNNFDKIIKIE